MSDGREHEHYVRTKQHVADAEARVAKQRGIIQARRATGRDTSAAQRLLYGMLQSLGHMQEHLRMIEAELTRDGQ
jgi:hypothetical protein